MLWNLKGLIDGCWRFFKWGLLLAIVAAAVVVPYAYHRMDDEIRRRIEARIAEQYPGLAVTVRSARLIEGEGIEIRGLSIVEPGAVGPTAELAFLDETFLVCRPDWQELIQGKINIRQIVIRRPTIRITHRADGSWSAARLLPLPKLGDQPPGGRVENGVVEIYDPLHNPASRLTLRDANLEFAPATNTVPGRDGRRPLGVHGRMTGDHVRRIDIDATFDHGGTAWLASGAVEGLELSPELGRALPGDAVRRLALLGSIRAQAKGRFLVRYEAAAEPRFTFNVSGQLSRGQVYDPRLPYPLTDLRATFRCDQWGFVVEDLLARSGQAALRLSLERKGYDPQSPLVLSAEGQRLVFNSELLNVLPDSWRDLWHQYLPAGEVDLRLKVAYDGNRWHPEQVVATCHNVAFTYYKFPYRLEGARGTVRLVDQVLSVHLTALGGGEEVRINGELRDPGADWTGSIDVWGNNLRFDEKLFLALDGKQRKVLRSLNPRGTFDLDLQLWRAAEPRSHPHMDVVVGLNRCSMRFDKFPYPLDNVRGTIEVRDGTWTFRDLEGTNDTGLVTCRGRLIPTQEGSLLELDLHGAHVPLEEELRDALGPGAQRLWHELKLRGTVDLDATVDFLPRQPRPRVWIRAQPLADPAANEAVSIEPARFPYRLDKLGGVFTFSDGHMELAQLRAEHGRTRLSGRGHCDLDPDGGWRLHLEDFAVDRLRADHDLFQALGGRLKKAVTQLRPGGPVDLGGTLDLASSGQPGTPISCNWDLHVDFHEGSIACGVDLDNLQGGLSLAGGFDGRHFHSHGELDMHSLTWKDYQFTSVRGPVWLDDRQVLFGLWADRRRGVQPERHLTWELYGGRATGDGSIILGAAPRYTLQATLAQADLARWVREAIPGRQQLSGQVSAGILLHGKGPGAHNLGGRGSVQLRNADLYELPLMVALLKTLSGRLPDSTAFTTSDIDFRIEGEHLYLNRIDFRGDAISLLGKGEMGLDKQIRLSFYTMVGRDEVRIPVVRELMGGASQQIMLVHVDGTLDEPVTRREVFPGVAQALQQFQLEPQGPGDRAPARIPAGGFLPPGRRPPARE